MASATNFRPRLTREEAVGLIVAALAHAALFAWLAIDPPGKPVVAPPERMTVTLSADSGPQATSPEPLTAPAEALAPEPDEMAAAVEAEQIASPEVAAPAAPLPVPVPSPVPAPTPATRAVSRPPAKAVEKPAAKPAPKPSPKAAAKPPAKPAPKPPAKPAPKAAEKPAPKAAAKPAPKAAAKPAPKAAARPAAKGEQSRRQPEVAAAASRIGSDFLKGVPDDQASGRSATPSAAAAGPQVAASLSQAIARQLKPHWTAPQGADAEKLVTVLAWELRPDGSLAGRPRIVSQSGITDANRAQRDRHAEQAIRAVQVAAPFRLPQQHYASWRRVSAFRFDRKLSR